MSLLSLPRQPRQNQIVHKLHTQTETSFRIESETGFDKWNTVLDVITQGVALESSTRTVTKVPVQ